MGSPAYYVAAALSAYRNLFLHRGYSCCAAAGDDGFERDWFWASAATDNPLWLDVLKWGPELHYAGWFDIDWSAHAGAGGGKLLAPVLGEQYGEALRAGKLKLRFDAEAGAFAVWAYDAHKLPICPPTYPMILGRAPEVLDRIGDRFLDLPNWRPQVAERARGLEAELAELARRDADALEAIEERVESVNRDWRELDRLIEAQHWRVAFFRVAEDEINYRRFFNINDLAGLRMELAPVFTHAHARIFTMLAAGEIEGLRIDHIDGLFDPKAYLDGASGARRAAILPRGGKNPRAA